MAAVPGVDAEDKPGQIRCFGICESDNQSMDGLTMASTFLRARCYDIKNWLDVATDKPPSLHTLRTQPKNLALWVLPVQHRTAGSSISVCIFLSLLCVYFPELRLKPRVAVTGILTLFGCIDRIGDVILKVSLHIGL